MNRIFKRRTFVFTHGKNLLDVYMMYPVNDRLKKYLDAIHLYRWAKIQALPYGQKNFVTISLDEILVTIIIREIGYFVDATVKTTDTVREIKIDFFPTCLESEKFDRQFFTDFKRKILPPNYTPVNFLICIWTDEKTYFIL